MTELAGDPQRLDSHAPTLGQRGLGLGEDGKGAGRGSGRPSAQTRLPPPPRPRRAVYAAYNSVVTGRKTSLAPQSPPPVEKQVLKIRGV